MSRRLVPDLVLAVVAAVVLIAGCVSPAAAAVHDDQPQPSTSPTDVATEAPTPTPTDVATPAPAATDGPVVPPRVVSPPFSASSPSAASGSRIEYSGTLSRFSDDGIDIDPSLRVFQVGTQFLLVDVEGTNATSIDGEARLEVSVPRTVDGAGDDALTRLADFSTGVEPLRVSRAPASRQTAAMINQTPRLAPGADITHQLFLISVTPRGSHTQYNQLSTYMKQAGAHANYYWRDQSNDSLGMINDYASTNVGTNGKCTTAAGTVTIWNAAARDAARHGFVGAAAQHVVAVLPWNAKCGGVTGLATMGTAVDSGGALWILGSDQPEEQAALIHELGHNMSLGHADWLECAASAPLVGAAQSHPSTGKIDGCEVNYAGDISDVMGAEVEGVDGPTLSSPSAIRARIWEPTAFAVAPVGTATPYTLNAISSVAGLRSVVVQDADGTEYYVEYRTFTGRDAQLSGLTCYPESGTDGGGACLQNTAGVRILRFEPWNFDGQPGSDTYLIGHDGTSVKFGVGETFTTASGLGVTVSAMTSDTATIAVTRPDAPRVGGAVAAQSSYSYDGEMRVGDTWTALLGSTWVADGEDVSYQWLRNGELIPGATAADYKLVSQDYKAKLSVRVTAPGNAPEDPDIVATSPQYGPVKSSVEPLQCPYPFPGIVRAVPLSVNTGTLFPPGTTFTYQWGHGAPGSFKAIKGQTKPTYKLTTADLGYVINVHVSGKVPGYQGTSFCLDSYNVTLNYGGSATMSGEPKVGELLTQTNDYVGPGITFDVATQWLRNGKVITDEDDVTYRVRPGDYGAKIALRTTLTYPGFAPRVLTTAGLKITQLGTFVPGPIPTITETTAPQPIVSVDASAAVQPTPDGPAPLSYQWFRNGTKIVGATHPTYTPVKADADSPLSVTISAVRTGYTRLDIPVPAVPGYGAIVAGPLGKISDTTPKVGQQILAPYPFGPTPTPDAGVFFQWYVGSKAVSGATGDNFTVPASAKGKTIKVRVTGYRDGFIPIIQTSSSTSKVR